MLMEKNIDYSCHKEFRKSNLSYINYLTKTATTLNYHNYRKIS